MTQVTVGLLYPGYAAEDDFPALEKRLDRSVRLPLVHTSVGEDAHRVDALLDLGGAPRLAEGAKALQPHNPDSVMWACTSGGFVYGWDGARKQVEDVSALIGVSTSSTSIAFVDAAHALGVGSVAVAASYPADVADHFVRFLNRGGLDVTTFTSHGIVTAAEVGRLDQTQVIAMVGEIDTAGADALLVPDTAMHSLAWVDEMEATADMPVLTANQVTVWKGLQMLGTPPTLDGLGTLFRQEPR